jgi:hypothetical protein
MPDSSDTKPVRPSEHLDWDALAAYARPKLAAVLGDRLSSPLTVEQFNNLKGLRCGGLPTIYVIGLDGRIIHSGFERERNR